MFNRILVPTEGSAASMVAVDAAVGFAHETGARLIGLHVLPLRPLHSHLVGVTAGPEIRAVAQEYLGYLKRRAKQADVPVDLLMRTSDRPYEEIIKSARDFQCDLIVMGSHGGGAAAAVLLGSQTQAVLTHSAIPVLVIPQRTAAAASTT